MQQKQNGIEPLASALRTNVYGSAYMLTSSYNFNHCCHRSHAPPFGGASVLYGFRYFTKTSSQDSVKHPSGEHWLKPRLEGNLSRRATSQRVAHQETYSAPTSRFGRRFSRRHKGPST